MIDVIIKRAWSDERATLGMLTIKGVVHDPFFVLENPERETFEDSRIPAGFYTCVPYSGTKFKGVYLVKDVPSRSGILIHPGNYAKDTLGCILLGESACTFRDVPMVMNSKFSFRRFKDLIGENVFDLTIT